MPRDPEGARTFRRFLVLLLLIQGAVVAFVGGWLLYSGKPFYAFLALCVLGWLMLVISGYRREAAEAAETEE